MIKKLICIFSTFVLFGFLIFAAYSWHVESTQPKEITIKEVYYAEDASDSAKLSDDDIKLIALVTMAEAEGECEEGKRLVIDTILNRLDSEYFPNTVHDVVYQPNQYPSMTNGRANRCKVQPEVCNLVWKELILRTNYNVIFFNSGGYSIYGIPMFQVENHYFSSYGKGMQS